MRLYLAGHSVDFESLRGLFPENAGPVWFGIDAGGDFMCDKRVRETADRSEMMAAAKVTLRRALGAAKLVDHTVQAVILNGTWVDSEGRSGVVIMGSSPARGKITLSGNSTLMGGGPVPNPPGAAMLARSENDEVVAEVFDLFGVGDLTWFELYKIFEIVRDEAGGGTGLEESGWATKSHQRAFTAAANRADVSGSAARHARNDSSTPPRLVMNFEQANEFVVGLVERWMSNRTIPPGVGRSLGEWEV